MVQILITLLTFVLILVSLFLVFIVLMQRSSSSGGLGTAFGGGLAESAFGTETATVLTRLTHWAAGTFYVISFVLYCLFVYSGGMKRHGNLPGSLPENVGGEPTATAPAQAGTAMPEAPAGGLEPAGNPPLPGSAAPEAQAPMPSPAPAPANPPPAP